jgi:hypothetical protein
MLAMLFTTFIAAAFVTAAGTIIGTWRRYASAWDALSAETARFPGSRRFLTVAVLEERPAQLAFVCRLSPFWKDGACAFTLPTGAGRSMANAKPAS